MQNIFNREVRKYLYGVAAASIPVLIFMGVLDAEAAVYLVPLLVAIFNINPKDSEVLEGDGEV